MKPVIVYCYVESGGDGSVCLRWFLSEATAEKYGETDEERFDENVREVETFEGSKTHQEAVNMEARYQ